MHHKPWASDTSLSKVYAKVALRILKSWDEALKGTKLTSSGYKWHQITVTEASVWTQNKFSNVRCVPRNRYLVDLGSAFAHVHVGV